jgi:formate hydrogenlyase subunit 3/multisubunit Na+/H+ antiporter MnhD subunit
MKLNILLYPIIIPFLAGLITFIVPRSKKFKQFLTIAVTGIILYYAFRLFLLPELIEQFFSIEFYGFKADFILKADHFSKLLILFTYLFGFLISIYAVRYRDWVVSGDNQYLTYFLWTLSGVSGVFLSANLFFLLIFWEALTAIFFLFINLGRGVLTAESARKTYVILGLADAAFFFGVIYIWTINGTLNIDAIHINTDGGIVQKVVFFTFIAASIAKAGALPLHTWIPAISENAPITVMALIPASLDKLMGIYLLSLTMLKIFIIPYIFNFVVMLIGALTVIIAVLIALIQHNLRKLLSFHAVSQVGYMVLGIASGTLVGVIGGLFHMINHAIYKSGLFLCAGAVEKETGTTELSELGGLYRKMPIVLVGNILLAFAISGVPPLNGFTSKWMVYQGLLQAGQPVLLVLAIFGSALTLASFLKVIYSVYFGGESPVFKKAKKPSYLMSIPIIILALLCLLFGIFATLPVSKFFIPIDFKIFEGVKPIMLLENIRFVNTLWNPSLATTAIIIGLVIGFIIYLIGKIFNYREQPIYTGGERFELEERRIPGTDLYLTILDLPIIGRYLKDRNEGVYDGYNIIKIIGYEAIVKKLKNMHNGILSTYLSWCIIGLMIIMFVLMSR